MGNKEDKIEKIEEIKKEENIVLSRTSFEFLSIIGRGGFGKVWKVSLRKNNKIFAMKEMSKTKIIDKRSEKSIKAERDFLSCMDHPFIINMHFAFQDKDNLYLGLDLVKGGDLRYHLCLRENGFNEAEAKFLLANLILGLEYLHANKIIHRDIKPENLVLDSDGYMKITDFGIAHKMKENNKTETSGTPGYMAPEVLFCMNHTIVADYFALGVIGYEIIIGKRPYLGSSRKEIKDVVMSKQIKISLEKLPSGWTAEAADFVNKLIQRKPKARLGHNSIEEIKGHPWYKYYNWKDLYLHKMSAPFKPKPNIEENIDEKYCSMKEVLGVNTEERYRKIVSHSEYKTVFKNYLYFIRVGENIKDPFENPHDIYEELERKEFLAFGFGNRVIVRKRRVESCGDIAIQLSEPNKEPPPKTPKHRKVVSSVK